jgi:tetratricopeptide (TPR) repeat protein
MNLDKLKDTTAALTALKEATAKYPEDADIIGIETDLYIKQNNIAKSQEALNKLIAKDPKKELYQYLMGDTYYKQALMVQETRKKIDAKKVKEYDAATAKMAALIDQSLPFYKKAAELNPTYVPALESLKQIYAFKNDMPNYEAIKKRLDAIPAN